MAASRTKKINEALTQEGWNDILLRDSPEDTGAIPSPVRFLSPDVICTQQQQVDPAQFMQNYDESPGKEPIANQNNFIYVRGKNLGTQASGGTVYLYWCRSSLLMWPEQWKSNVVQANVEGKWQPYNILPPVGGGQISVTQAPFIWNPLPLQSDQLQNDHYCIIAAVSTSTHPWSVSSLPTLTYAGFGIWVRSNPNICMRNITLVSNPNQPVWDRLDLVNIPGETSVPMFVMAQCTNVPIGTTVMLKNDELGITTSEVTASPNQVIYSKGVTCLAGYSGYIETLAQLAAGQTWPTGATITTTLFLGTTSSEPVARFAHNFGADENHPNVMQAKRLARGTVDGVLVIMGNCSTKMQPTA